MSFVRKRDDASLITNGSAYGNAVFPTSPVLRYRAEREFNVVQWNEYGREGRFATIEAPDLYAADLVQFFGSFERQ